MYRVTSRWNGRGYDSLQECIAAAKAITAANGPTLDRLRGQTIVEAEFLIDRVRFRFISGETFWVWSTPAGNRYGFEAPIDNPQPHLPNEVVLVWSHGSVNQWRPRDVLATTLGKTIRKGFENEVHLYFYFDRGPTFNFGGCLLTDPSGREIECCRFEWDPDYEQEMAAIDEYERRKRVHRW
jgi:hypothetical protein